MPRLSDKGLSLPPSPIRKLVSYAEEAARHGVKVYHLNIGQPDIPTPQVAIDAVKNIHDKIFAYGHSAGLRLTGASWSGITRVWGSNWVMKTC